MRRYLFLLMLLGCLTLHQSVMADSLGYTGLPNGSATFSGSMRGHVFTATTSFIGTYIVVYVNNYSTPGFQLRAAIYDVAGGGVPQNLIAETTTKVMQRGWNELALLSSATVTAGQNYYLVVQFESTTSIGVTSDMAFVRYQRSHSWGTFPDPAGVSSTLSTNTYCIYLTDIAATPTSTSTSTHTPTATPTVTATPSITITSTITHTRTATSTATMSPTITPTITPSPTITMTPTISMTQTASATITMTRTITETFTCTVTKTITSTQTVTPTITPTVTPTRTITLTSTITLTTTQTPDYTQTPTATRSPTITPTSTVTPSPTISPTQTKLSTSTVTSDRRKQIEVNAFPVPAKRAITFQWEEQNAESVAIIIYNVIGERMVDIHVGANARSVQWMLDDIAAGIYFYRIQIIQYGKSITYPFKKIVITK